MHSHRSARQRNNARRRTIEEFERDAGEEPMSPTEDLSLMFARARLEGNGMPPTRHIDEDEEEECGSLHSDPGAYPPGYDFSAADAIYQRYVKGEAALSGEALMALGEDMGFPQRGNPDFLYFTYAAWQTMEQQTRDFPIVIAQDSWHETLQNWGVSTPQALANRARSAVRRMFLTGSGDYNDFHRYVFTYLLIASRDFRKLSFARTIPIGLAQDALYATLASGKTALSPFVNSFTAFLRTKTYENMNMDQWNSFLAFTRSVTFPTFENYHEDNCWPIMIDEYVEWATRNGVGAGAPHSCGGVTDSVNGLFPRESTPSTPARATEQCWSSMSPGSQERVPKTPTTMWSLRQWFQSGQSQGSHRQTQGSGPAAPTPHKKWDHPNKSHGFPATPNAFASPAPTATLKPQPPERYVPRFLQWGDPQQ